MITADGVVVRLGGRTAIDGVDLAVPNGTITGLVGPNGSGKSTLLRAIMRAVPVSGGTIRVDGQITRRQRRRWLAQRIAFVGQHPIAESALTVRDEIELGGLAEHGLVPGPAATSGRNRAVEEALEATGLTPLAEKALGELSGGERQRVAIARAIAQRAPHAVLDEPLNHLDLRHQLELMQSLHRIAPTVVVALHDLELAARWCDQILLLDHGRAVAAGTPDQVLTTRLIDQVYDVETFTDRGPDGHPRFQHQIPTPTEGAP